MGTIKENKECNMRKLFNKNLSLKASVIFPAAVSAMLLGSLSTNVMAASEPALSITITGKIVDNTCTVDTEGSDLNNVSLVDVSARDLKGIGTTLGKKDIKLALKGCGKDITRGLVVTASGDADTSDTEGFAFKNVLTENAATGVGLLFYKSADNQANPFKAEGEDSETITGLGEGANVIHFAAAYVATEETPGAGNFSTTVNLTLAYQ
jgi:major type 1 subunit fimbrin (pilin)